MQSDYKTCPDCGHNYSVLVRHRCFKAPKQKDPPKFDDPAEGDGQGEGEGEGEGEGQNEAEGEGQGQQGEGGEGEGQGEDGQGEGESEGEGQSEGEGEGDTEAEQDDEAKAEGKSGQSEPPPPPEPTAMEMVTLLRFAALTAKDATAFVKVEVEYDGLAIFASSGDKFAQVVIPWEELAKQDTQGAEATILTAVKDIDYKITDAEPKDEQAKDGDWIVLPTGKRDSSCKPEGNPIVEVVLYYDDDIQDDYANNFYWENSGNDDYAIARYRILKR